MHWQLPVPYLSLFSLTVSFRYRQVVYCLVALRVKEHVVTTDRERPGRYTEEIVPHYKITKKEKKRKERYGKRLGTYMEVIGTLSY